MNSKQNNICKVAKKCGACQLSNMDYERQLKFKQAGEVKLLKRFGHVNNIIGMQSPYNYRNKAQYSVKKASNGNIVTGVYQSVTGGVAVTDSCFINNKKSNEIVKYLRRLLTELKVEPYNPKSRNGLVRHIMVRNGYVTGEYMVVLVCIEDKFIKGVEEKIIENLCEKFNEIKTIVLNVNKNNKMMLGSKERILYGNGYIEDILCGKRFRISPRSFYQVNPVQTEILYKTAINFAKLSCNERVLDAYCGIGSIGISASDNVKSIVGVEINEEAVKDARINAKLNGIENAEYYKIDAAAFMRKAAENDEHFDVVFTDPPRAGCSKVFLSSLVMLNPNKIVYISCNPETLSRDLYFLIHNGYKVQEIQPVDMFPHTKHVETVVLLQRENQIKISTISTSR